MSDQENNKEANQENNQPENTQKPEENPQQENQPQVSNEEQNPKPEEEKNPENQAKEEQTNEDKKEQEPENNQENKQENEQENIENKQPEENPEEQNQEEEQNNEIENQEQENIENQVQKNKDERDNQNEIQNQNQTNRNKKPINIEAKSGQKLLEDIQQNIQSMAIKIEHEKINLRITSERLTQKEKQYNELQGKPVVKTKEEKEKERKEHKKAVKSHKLSDPIIRKKGKEKEFYDEQIRIQKIYDKNKVDFEKLTCDINELVIGNKNLKQQIVDLRKRKFEAQKQLETIVEENQKKQEELEEILKDNKTLKDQIKYKEYQKVVEYGNMQEKNFVAERDDYENQYHEIIKDYVKREKETKKENAKKRQMALLGSGSPTHFKGMNDKDIERQLKILAEEEISDRTPILDLEIEKWTEINRIKKLTLQRHYENCVKIEDAFKKLLIS